MNIKKEEAYQHVLSMDLSHHHFQCAIVDPSAKKIVDSTYTKIDKFEKDAIANLIAEDFFSFDYQNIILSSGTERNTLIPVDIFNDSDAKDIFNLNFSEPFDNIDYNRIPELGIVNVYEFPLWIKSLFVIRFPRVKLVHRSSVLLRALFDQPTFSPIVHLFVEEQRFYLMITAKSKLQYFNSFDSVVTSDIVYHTLNVLQQKEIKPTDVKVNIYGQPSDWSEKEELHRLIGCKINIDETVEKSEKFILAKQLLCV